MKKRTAIIIIIVVVAIISIAIIVKKTSDKRSDIPEVNDTIVTTTCTSNSISEEEISAMVSEMVESQINQRLSEEATHTEASTTAKTTVSQQSESFSTTDLTTTETTKVSSVDTDITATVSHNGTKYSLRLTSSKYQAALQSRFLSEKGRELSVSFDSENINRIRVATAFVDSEGLLSDFGEFTKVEFTSDETGTSFSYTIPDNPNADIGYHSTINFCAVFRIETGDSVIYTAISY